MPLRSLKSASIGLGLGCLSLAAAPAQPMDAKTIATAIRASNLEPEIHALVSFELAPPGETGSAFEVEAPGGHELLAYDGSGGEYHLLEDGRILLIGSEGSAGVIASDFQEFIGIAMGLSSWLDALGFVGRADLRAARAEWTGYEAQWALKEAMDGPWQYDLGDYSVATPAEARERILDYFEIAPPADPFGALYRATNERSDKVAVYLEGEKYGSFGAAEP